MPRPKYAITSDDLAHARSYLELQLRTFGIVLRDGVTLKHAELELVTAATQGTKTDRARQVNAWCERYLSSAEWRKLKIAIRKRRERRKNGERIRTVTVSALSHEYLTKLAKRDNVTFSKVLEKYLGQVLKRKT